MDNSMMENMLPAEDQIKKILLVEDQMIIALSQISMLEKNGYAVIHADTGENALNIVMADPSIDLILMDIDFGDGMDGSEAAKKILQFRTLPIVFLTSHSEKDMVDKVKSITRYGYVIKNSGLFVLLSSIEMAFELFEAHQNINAKVEELNEKKKIFKKIFNTNSVLMALSSLNDGKFIEVNETFMNKLGYTREEIIGRTPEFIIDKASIESAAERSKSPDCSNHFESRLLTKSGDTVYGLCSIDVIEMNGKKFMLSSMIDITENKFAKESAQRSEAYYHLLADHIKDVVWLMDLDLRTIYCSPSVCKLRGFTVDEVLTMPIEKQLTEESLERVLKIYNAEKIRFMRDADYPFVLSIETEYYKKDGTTIWTENIITLIRDKDGNPESILGEGRDITDRKHAEDKVKRLLAEKELLLKEVHHRMKNNMCTIASLLYLQCNSTDNISAANTLREACNRVQSMMIVYDKLYRSCDYLELSSRDYLSDLINTISPAINTSSDIDIIMDIDDFLIDSASLFPVGIIINELLSNAFKYAFPDGSGGVISISLKIKDENFELIFKDNGIGLTETVTSGVSESFGIKLVNILVKQLKGSMELINSNGTEYRIKFSSLKISC